MMRLLQAACRGHARTRGGPSGMSSRRFQTEAVVEEKVHSIRLNRNPKSYAVAVAIGLVSGGVSAFIMHQTDLFSVVENNKLRRRLELDEIVISIQKTVSEVPTNSNRS